ncbi:hypothetical protein [Bifidobacterium leontopitheci]|uniref:Uncharacterized protein n=1 Tax=Bifidobacterium leontopitheci TaxID=2650774 RepID=A0A6I1GNT0_9BIFI|nr:hypothetical protein [Bifidobacterium leontopitheci]KAB7790967.1 hypothetical protein F7D09_0513 [Bifidobacterium leontopitheci]
MKNFFKGISFSSIAAGALAAVTSFLLSAKIGIAGSVIGVAIGSVVSAVSTQIYKNVLSESGKKLQDVAGVGDSGESAESGAESSTEGNGTARPASGETTRVITTSGTMPMPAIPAPPDDPEATVVGLHGIAQHDGGRRPRTAGSAAAQAEGLLDGRNSDATRVIGSSAANMAHDGRTASGVAGAKAAGKSTAGKSNRTKRIAIIVSVVSALAAVGLTAAIIMLVTQGQGTDTVVRDWVNQSNTPSRQEQYRRPDTTTNDKKSDGTTDGTTGNSDNTDGTDSTDDDGTTSSNGTEGSDSGSNSGSDGTGSSGSSSSGSSSSGNSSSNSGSGSSSGNSSNGSGSSSSNSGSGSSDSNGSSSGSESSGSSSSNGSGSSSGSGGSSSDGSSGSGSTGSDSSSGASTESATGGSSGGIGTSTGGSAA